jgi:hypothetical protein
MSKCVFCGSDKEVMFGSKAPVCQTHYQDLIDEQRAYYCGDISNAERDLMNVLYDKGYFKRNEADSNR